MVDIKPLGQEDEKSKKKKAAETKPAEKVVIAGKTDKAPDKDKQENVDDLKQQFPDQKKKVEKPAKMSPEELLSSQKYFVSIKQKRQKTSPVLFFPLVPIIVIVAVVVFGIIPMIDNIPADTLDDLRGESQLRINQSNEDATERQERADQEAQAQEQAQQELDEQTAAAQAEEEQLQIERASRNAERRNDLETIATALEAEYNSTGFYPQLNTWVEQGLPNTDAEIYVSPDGTTIQEGTAIADNNDYYFQGTSCDDQGCAEFTLSVYLEAIGTGGTPTIFEIANTNQSQTQ